MEFITKNCFYKKSRKGFYAKEPRVRLKIKICEANFYL